MKLGYTISISFNCLYPLIPGWDVVVNILSGLINAGFQVTSLWDATIKQFSTSEAYMWVKTQLVCIEQ